MRRFAPTMILWVTFCSQITAQDATDVIDRLAADLASDDPKIREHATQEFIKIGKPAIEAVKRLLESSDAELKARAESILKGIREGLRTKALKLEVATDKKAYTPGEEVKITATLKNVEEFPVVVLPFLWDGGITANSWITITLDGEPIRYDGDPLGQVMVQSDVDEHRFVTIKPKEVFGVRSVQFSRYWNLGDKNPHLKSSYRDSKTLELKPGKYKIKATYAFRFDRRSLESGRLKFHGNAQDLLGQAWTGSLEAEAEFTVAEK